jgi:hypothetical protein
MVIVLKCLLTTTSPNILILISSSMVKLASNEFADFLPSWMTLDYQLVDFLHLVTTPAENQRPIAINVSDSFLTNLPLLSML